MTWYAVHSTPSSFGSIRYIRCPPAGLLFSTRLVIEKTRPADICLLLLCYLVLVTFAFIMELLTLHSCGCVIKVANRIILSRSDGQQDIE